MTDMTAIERWLERYVKAWRTGAPSDIAPLFAPDATYYPEPYSAPYVGVDAIAAWWADQGDSKIDWTFSHDVLAREGDCYVVRGVTRYPEGSDGEVPKVYYNIWLVTLDGSDTATEFVEYWMRER